MKVWHIIRTLNGITVRAKADYEARKWLKVGTNMNFSRAKYHVIPSDDNGLFYQ